MSRSNGTRHGESPRPAPQPGPFHSPVREETARVVSNLGTYYALGKVEFYLDEGEYGDGKAAQALRDLLSQFTDEPVGGGSPMTTAEYEMRVPR